MVEYVAHIPSHGGRKENSASQMALQKAAFLAKVQGRMDSVVENVVNQLEGTSFGELGALWRREVTKAFDELTLEP